ncbi:hypothetical protein ES706_05583 [subsurface metagenome]
MDSGKLCSTSWHRNRLLEANNQNTTFRACIVEHLGIAILLHLIWNSELDSAAPFRFLILVPRRLDPLLPQRHSLSTLIDQRRSSVIHAR